MDDLINRVNNIRDKAIIALFTESGLRLSELVNIRLEDIDWQGQTIRVIGKGRKEALALGLPSRDTVLPLLNTCVPLLSEYHTSTSM